MDVRGILRVLLWVAGGCVLYVSAYYLMSRVTAVTWETRAFEPRANTERVVLMFTFFGEERRYADVGHVYGAKLTDRQMAIEKLCYYLFFPVIELDARGRMRYHAFRSSDIHNIDAVDVW